VGANFGQLGRYEKLKSGPENVIIPEKANESKGLLRSLVWRQGLERTGFFGPEAAYWPKLVTRACGTRGLAETTGPLPPNRYRTYPFFMEPKNSSLFLVARSLSSRNSVASSSSMPKRSFRRIQTLGRMSGPISSSSRRVPERFTLSEG
jgi:hypothetical protein